MTKSIILVCAVTALFIAGTRVGLTEGPTLTYWSGQATITTANCSGSGGLCQGGDPSTCNNNGGPANGANGANGSATSCLPCNNGAGPNPAASPGPAINASVSICELRVTNSSGYGGVGSVLKVTGTGTGFQPGHTYVSLLYQNPNTATCSRFPAGVPPTLENATNPLSGVDNDFASMHLGFWVRDPEPNPTGHATLNVVKQATLTGLNNYTTVSVREMQPPNTTCFNCGLDPAPQLNALRACGPLIVTNDGCSIP